MRSLWNDESGFIVCSELVLVATVLVIGLLVGMVEVRNALTNELNDVGNAVGSANQSYEYSGLSNGVLNGNGCLSYVAGSRFVDHTDGNDGNGTSDFSCHVAPGERITY